MNKLNHFFFAIISFGILLLPGCKKDSTPDQEITGKAPFAEGVFIINEGKFPSGVGSVSFYNRISGKVQNDIFSDINGIPLGSVAQSIEFYDSNAYIVVNNSKKVEVVDAGTFESVGTIIGLNSPRYFLGINSTKGYISDWPNHIAVVNLQDFTIVENITTGSGPEKMLRSGDDVYVINIGGLGIDSTVSIIDSDNDQVIKTIQVGKRPTGIVKDAGGSIWVMCSGKGFNGWTQDDDTEGHLINIDPVSHTIQKDIIFPGNTLHPEKLAINKDGSILYFLYSGGIYSINISTPEYEYSVLVESGNFYNLGCDPVSNIIFASDPVDYDQRGFVLRYNLVNGSIIDSLKVGVIPGEFCFR